MAAHVYSDTELFSVIPLTVCSSNSYIHALNVPALAGLSVELPVKLCTIASVIVNVKCVVSTVSVSLPQELHAALAHIWEEQKFTDVDFLISGQVVPAHKAVLASQSQYFESMLYGSMKEAAMNEVELKDVPVPAFRKVLQFAYTGFLDMENVALQVLYHNHFT